ncbi:MAG TPA: allantoicase [Bacteroidota bacterium]|jgi:allantoicase
MTATATNDIGTPAGLVDLASERLGGKVLMANDEFFAPKENLIKAGRGVFIPDKYTDRGKWMDGWETRRRRTPGFDWCVVQLGLSGIIRKVDIDTNHFLGNHPPQASLDAVRREINSPFDPETAQESPWVNIIPQSPLNPGSQNLFDVTDTRPWTHALLKIFPDGGVARLRLYGNVVPDWSRVRPGTLVDLAAIENGGAALSCSDMFFSSMNNLIMPGPPVNMGDGWETKRRRGPGHDWIIIRLGAPGTVVKVEVDTTHFKGNYPDTCSIDACHSKAASASSNADAAGLLAEWKELLPVTKLAADTKHVFEKELRAMDAVTHIRLNIHPDGGVGRLRVWGKLKQA